MHVLHCSCPNCLELHPDDLDQLIEDKTDWEDRVVVGPMLRTLSGLRQLAVSFGSGDFGVRGGRR